MPVLLVGQLIMEQTFRAIARHVREAGLLVEEELIRLDPHYRKTYAAAGLDTARADDPRSRLCSSALFIGARLSIAAPWTVLSLHPCPAGWYAALVSPVERWQQERPDRCPKAGGVVTHQPTQGGLPRGAGSAHLERVGAQLSDDHQRCDSRDESDQSPVPQPDANPGSRATSTLP